MDEAAGSDGHRKILTDQGTTANTMGYGHASGANCWKTFDVGDSGNLKNATIPKIPTAAVSPASGAAGNVHLLFDLGRSVAGGAGVDQRRRRRHLHCSRRASSAPTS